MAAAALLASFEGKVRIPAWSFILAQGVVGCLVARAIGSAASMTMVRQWPVFLTGVLAVIAIATALGALLARWKVLPGTTAIWGSSPGAATAMVLMAEAYGADIRLVAVMQYLRVAIVGLLASVVARTWGGSAAAPVATEWFPALAAGPFIETLALIVGGAVIGAKSKNPRRRAARAADRRLRPFGGPCRHHCAAALASRRVLRADRLVDRLALHPADLGLRRAAIAADRGLDFSP